MYAYTEEIQNRFSRKQSLEWKKFIPYFRFIFSYTINPVTVVPLILRHPLFENTEIIIKLFKLFEYFISILNYIKIILMYSL